eukprot:TRINITY_DN1360_c0_g2_i1.p1 TRINITY_DN1360_c0_g2~~TRINITY_DN1360_c0_g2_i1.p1  ORF type:complete len:479 (+),score=112.24 TRINITY_DN1360_c0_g2_i1:85-1521(+)
MPTFTGLRDVTNLPPPKRFPLSGAARHGAAALQPLPEPQRHEVGLSYGENAGEIVLANMTAWMEAQPATMSTEPLQIGSRVTFVGPENIRADLHLRCNMLKPPELLVCEERDGGYRVMWDAPSFGGEGEGWIDRKHLSAVRTQARPRPEREARVASPSQWISDPPVSSVYAAALAAASSTTSHCAGYPVATRSLPPTLASLFQVGGGSGQALQDPQRVTEYADDILRKLFREESLNAPRPDYMHVQQDVNYKMRGILNDWLIEVHMKYKMRTETLHLTIDLIDRYLTLRIVARKRLQLVGVSAMLVAAKFEEIHPPEVKDFVYITDNAYTKEDILNMECDMLAALQFKICRPTAAHFAEHFMEVNDCAEAQRHLVQYLLELALLEMHMLKYSASLLVASACWLSNRILKRPSQWPPAMVAATTYSEQVVKVCARDLCEALEATSVDGAAGRLQLQAVYKKFSLPAFSSVATMRWGDAV